MKTRSSRTRAAAATPSVPSMSDTTWLLMARYRGMPLIPIETVCRLLPAPDPRGTDPEDGGRWDRLAPGAD